MGATNCNPEAPEFKWNPKIFVGDSESESIVRLHKGEVQQIRCSDETFDHMSCITTGEIKKAKKAAYDLVNQCEKWKSASAAFEAEILLQTFVVLE